MATNLSQYRVENIDSRGSINGDIAKWKAILHKYNEKDVPLANAQFTLINESTHGKTIETTNQDGVIVFNNLTFGSKYLLVETKAPKGYEINSVTISILVNDSNGIPEVFMNNKQVKHLNVTDKRKSITTSTTEAVTS